MIQVAIVDDQKINREIVEKKLAFCTQLQLIGSYASGIQFIEAIKSNLATPQLPHVVLMDIDMPTLSGIETIAIASTLLPHIKFIVLTVIDDDAKIFEAIQAGACGYLLKEDDSVHLQEAIQQAIDNTGAPMSPAIARKTLFWIKNNLEAPSTHNSNTLLSQREVEILKLVAQGLAYKAIADQLFISPLTVRTHISKIYEKMHVHSKAQAIQMAHKLKWL
jgi:DNA-binding NarL/FixJ family response regulator